MSEGRYSHFDVGLNGRFFSIGEILDAAEREKRDGVAAIHAMPVGGRVPDYERIGHVRRRDGVVELVGIEPAEEVGP